MATRNQLAGGEPAPDAWATDPPGAASSRFGGAGGAGPPEVKCVSFSPCGRFLAAGCDDGRVTVWWWDPERLSSLSEVAAGDAPRPPPHVDPAAPAGASVAPTDGIDSRGVAGDMTDGEGPSAPPQEGDSAGAGAAVAGRRELVEDWSHLEEAWRAGSRLQSWPAPVQCALLVGHQAPVLHAVFMLHSLRLVTAGMDGQVRFWEGSCRSPGGRHKARFTEGVFAALEHDPAFVTNQVGSGSAWHGLSGAVEQLWAWVNGLGPSLEKGRCCGAPRQDIRALGILAIGCCRNRAGCRGQGQ